jgi:hypothetical protein
VKSHTTRKFWRLFDDLPADVQEHARRSYAQFAIDPSHPSLNFKRVDRNDPIYSVRIGIHFRALGLLEGDTVTWFWIGIHNDYERVLKG